MSLIICVSFTLIINLKAQVIKKEAANFFKTYRHNVRILSSTKSLKWIDEKKLKSNDSIFPFWEKNNMLSISFILNFFNK